MSFFKKYSVLLLIIVLAFSFFTACSEEDGIEGGGGLIVKGDFTTEFSPAFESFFNPTTMHEIKIIFTAQEWSALSNDLAHTAYADGYGRPSGDEHRFTTEISRQANFTNITTGGYANKIGIRVRGNTSRYYPQLGNNYYWAHFKISFSQDFAENEGVFGAPSIDIPTVTKTTKLLYGCRGLALKYHVDDPTGVKEVYAYKLLRDFGIPAPRSTFAKLTIVVDGTELPFGVYEVYEPIDKEFIRRRFGASSYLFKCLYKNYGPADLQNNLDSKDIGMEVTDPTTIAEASGWDPQPDSDWHPSTDVYGPKYDLKAKKTEFALAKTALTTFISDLNSKTGTEFGTWIATNFEVDLFLKSLAVTVTLGMWDDYWANANNYYLLKRPDNNKWVFIPYDYDHVFESDHSDDSFLSFGPTDGSRPLVNKILAIPAYLDSYKSYIRTLISGTNSYFTNTAVIADFQAMQTVIGTAAGAGNIVHSEASSDYTGNNSDITTFVNARVTKAIAEIGEGGDGFSSTYANMYIRGDNNSWGTSLMDLIGDYYWRITDINFSSGVDFKFAESSNWSDKDWGETGANDGIAELESGDGNNITVPSTGTYTIEFTTTNLAYTITLQ